MKKQIKRILSVVIALTLILAVLPTGGLMVGATSKSSDEAINWVKSKLNQHVGYDDGSGEYQCVELIQAYYVFLGVSSVSGNGADYAKNSKPGTWDRVQGGIPKKGDILVYTGGYNNYGHVAIYESDYSTYHQNFSYHPYVERITHIKYNSSEMGVTYWGYIRPDFNDHTHSYGSGVITTQPTCDKDGVKTFTCSCGAKKTETVSKTGHSYTSVVTDPTCVEGGYTTYTCSKCTSTYKSDITNPLNHNWVLEKTDSYCNNTATLTYHCSRCQDRIEKQINTLGGKTEFLEDEITDLKETAQIKTQYRSASKNVTTSKTSKELAGWTYEKTEYSEYGPWSDWTTVYVSGNELTHVVSSTIYMWYAFVCPNCGQHDPASGGCSNCGYNLDSQHFSYIWLDTPFSSGEPIYWDNKTKIYTGRGVLFSANDHDSETGYSYRTRTATYHFYKWSEFSDWQDEEITADENTLVETRTLYSYDLSAVEHTFNTEWSSDQNEHYKECSVCSEKTEIASHSYDNACDTTCNICGYVRNASHNYKTEWTKNETQHYKECSVCGEKTEIAGHIYDNDYDTNCNICGYVREVEEQDPNSPKLSVSSKRCVVGKTITLDLSIANNPGFTALNLALIYDKSNLTLVGVENLIGGFTMTSDSSIVWDGGKNYSSNGTIATLTFAVKEDATAGDYEIKVRFFDASNYDGDDVTFTTSSGIVTVLDVVFGDANGDGVVTTADLTVMRRYFASRDPETGEYTMEISAGADANDDGKITTADLTALRRYFASRDPETGIPSYILGPVEG